MPIEVPKLDDRNFDEILAEAVARIPVHTPEWNNFNDSDPGMTLVQLFAFMVDNLLYRSNRIPEANRAKFLELLGISLRPASAARGLVVFNNERGPLRALLFDRGLELFAGKVPFRSRTLVNILPVTSQVFYKHPTSVEAATDTEYKDLYGLSINDTVSYYQTETLSPPKLGQTNLPEVNILQDTLDDALWLALLVPKNTDREAIRAVIAGKTLSLGVYPSEQTDMEVLQPRSLEQQDVPPPLQIDVAIPQIPTNPNDMPTASYERLEIESAEDVLEMPGIIQVKLPPYEKIEPYAEWGFDPSEEGLNDLPPLIEDDEISQRILLWLRIRLANDTDNGGEDALDQQRGRISWIGANAARVIQALEVKNERLGVGTGVPHQRFKVTNTPVIVDPEPDRRTFHVEVNGETWRYTDDIYAADAADKVYHLDAESGMVTFGDGLRGLRPPRGASIHISYEYGGGSEGNVAIGAINKASVLPGGVKVSNPVRTWGADDAETVAAGERRISSVIRHRHRLVTAEDFHQITLQTPGVEIGRAAVLPLYDPSQQTSPFNTPGLVTVVVIPDHTLDQVEAPKPNRSFLQTVANWLEPRRLITTQVYVLGPEFVNISVSIGVETLPGREPSIIHKRVKEAVRRYLSPIVGGPEVTAPDGTRQGQGWPFRVSLHVYDLAAVAARVEGVRFVDPEKIRIGRIRNDGTRPEPVQSIAFERLELPWLRFIDVQEGQAAPLQSGGDVGGHAIPVPTETSKC